MSLAFKPDCVIWLLCQGVHFCLTYTCAFDFFLHVHVYVRGSLQWYAPTCASFVRLSPSADVESLLVIAPMAIHVYTLRVAPVAALPIPAAPPAAAATTAMTALSATEATAAATASSSLATAGTAAATALMAGAHKAWSATFGSSTTTTSITGGGAYPAPSSSGSAANLSADSSGSGPSAPDTHAPIALTDSLKHSWSIASWTAPTVAVTVPDLGGPGAATGGAAADVQGRWLARAELVTSAPEAVPLWASPQFNFQVYAAPGPSPPPAGPPICASFTASSSLSSSSSTAVTLAATAATSPTISASVLAFVCVEACPTAQLSYTRRRLDSQHEKVAGGQAAQQQEISAKITSAMRSGLPDQSDIDIDRELHEAEARAAAAGAAGAGAAFSMTLNESYIAP